MVKPDTSVKSTVMVNKLHQERKLGCPQLFVLSPVRSPHNYAVGTSLADLNEVAFIPFIQLKVTSLRLCFVQTHLSSSSFIASFFPSHSKPHPSVHPLPFWNRRWCWFSPCSWPLHHRAGVDSARVRQAGQIAGQTSTRRLGDYRAKLNYNDIDLLRYRLSTHTNTDIYIHLHP